MGSIPWYTDWLTVSCNVTSTSVLCPGIRLTVSVGSNWVCCLVHVELQLSLTWTVVRKMTAIWIIPEMLLIEHVSYQALLQHVFLVYSAYLWIYWRYQYMRNSRILCHTVERWENADLGIMSKSRDLSGRTVHVICLQKVRNTTNYMRRHSRRPGLRLKDRISSPSTFKNFTFLYRPNRLWGPPSLLSNGYRGLFSRR
jgi:hypothetical protein